MARQPAQRGTMGATYRAAREKPRARLNRDEIVRAAVRILDAEGPEALTFRRLAGDLSAGVGSLYWHVDSKEALLDLAFDDIVGELDDQFVDDDRPWPDRLGDGLFEFWRVLLRHPWAAHHASASRDRGPKLLRTWDRSAQILFDAGFDATDVFYASAALFSYVLGVSAQNANWSRNNAGRMTREEGMAEAAAFFDQLDPAEFPAFKRIAPVFATHDEDRQFRAGLDLLIAGLVARRPSA